MNKVKRLAVTGAASAVMLGSMAVPALAAGPYNAIPDSNPAFEDSGNGSIQNVHNNSLRFGQGGRIVVPGKAGEHANENSAVAEHTTGETIVDPQGY